jgi:hypothetical protein
MRMKPSISLLVFSASLLSAYAQQAEKPIPLFFRETFKAPPVASEDVVFTTQHAANPNLEVKLYGPGSKPQPDHESGLLLVNRGDGLPGSGVTSFVWSGMTEANWAVTLRDKSNHVDLTGPAKIRWRIRPRSFRGLRLVLKLADGTMVAADYVEPDSTYFRETEFYLVDIPRWRVLDPVRVIEGADTAWRTNVDLSKVDEIGFTDLSRGAGHNPAGSSAVDWIEVYGKPVKRAASN